MNIFSNQSHVNSKEPPSQRWEASLSLQSPGKLDSESCLPESRCYQVCSLSSLSGTPLLPSGLPRVFPEGSQCVILPPSPKLTLSTTDLQVPGRIAYGKNEPRFILHVDGRALHGGRLQFCASLDVETWASTFSGSGKDLPYQKLLKKFFFSTRNFRQNKTKQTHKPAVHLVSLHPKCHWLVKDKNRRKWLTVSYSLQVSPRLRLLYLGHRIWRSKQTTWWSFQQAQQGTS